jgi:hypothetical protein
VLGHAVRLGAFGRTSEAARALERLQTLDPTGRIAALERLIARAQNPPTFESEWGSGDPDVSPLLSAGLVLAEVRAGGASLDEGLARAFEVAGPSLHAAMRHALTEAARDAAPFQDHATHSRRSA